MNTFNQPHVPIAMKTFRLSFLFTILALFAAGFAPAHAQSDEEAVIKQRMIERVDEIDALKLAQKVGENRSGLLEQRAMLTPAETTLMNAENTDRRALYTLIAQKLGLTTTVVGQGRADELRKRSAKGVWLQAPDGNWYQKS